jgi:hypothetical protein
VTGIVIVTVIQYPWVLMVHQKTQKRWEGQGMFFGHWQEMPVLLPLGESVYGFALQIWRATGLSLGPRYLIE